MQILPFQDYHTLSDFAASQIALAIKNKPSLTLCMACWTYASPLLVIYWVRKLKEENIDYSSLRLGLDK